MPSPSRLGMAFFSLPLLKMIAMNQLLRLSLSAILLTTLLALPSFAAEHTSDTLAEVKKNVEQEKAVLLDVREKQEWEQGHVKDAILFPMSQLQHKDRIDRKKLEELLPKNKVIYTYCKVGGRALACGKILEEFGYEVRNLKPGFDQLKAAGFETQTK